MGSFSIWHWLIVLVVVLVLFGGGGKISRLMGDFGKGLKAFKKGMKEEEGAQQEGADQPQALSSGPAPQVPPGPAPQVPPAQTPSDAQTPKQG